MLSGTALSRQEEIFTILTQHVVALVVRGMRRYIAPFKTRSRIGNDEDIHLLRLRQTCCSIKHSYSPGQFLRLFDLLMNYLDRI